MGWNDDDLRRLINEVWTNEHSSAFDHAARIWKNKNRIFWTNADLSRSGDYSVPGAIRTFGSARIARTHPDLYQQWCKEWA